MFLAMSEKGEMERYIGGAGRDTRGKEGGEDTSAAEMEKGESGFLLILRGFNCIPYLS